MTYTHVELLEALDILQHQYPDVDWAKITDKLESALKLVVQRSEWKKKKPFKSSFSRRSIVATFYNMQRRI